MLFGTLVACHQETMPVDSPFVMQRHRPSSLRRHVDPLPGNNFQPSGVCRGLVSAMDAQAGPDAVHCSADATGILCANAAFRNRRTFTMCSGAWGMDSWMESGVAGLPDGDLMSFYLDTRGARYRGTCPRAEVSLDPAGWPECRIALIDRVDLSTGQKYVEFGETYGEAWPPPCAADAMRAKRPQLGLLPRKRVPLVSDPSRWKINCGRFSVGFELLVALDGRVRCVRLTERTEKWPPGLAEEIRKNLKSWTFVAPNLDGQPLEVRLGWRENDVCGTQLR